MRPPVLPSGKHALVEPEQARRARCFNEAAGFTRRKPLLTGVRTGAEQALLQ